MEAMPLKDCAGESETEKLERLERLSENEYVPTTEADPKYDCEL